MQTKTQKKTASRKARQNRIRARVIGSALKPRLAIFKSNTALYAQLIDDAKGQTLVAADTRKVKGDNLMSRAATLGGEIAKAAKEKKVSTVVFDRGGFRFQGAIAALAEAARAGGLKF